MGYTFSSSNITSSRDERQENALQRYHSIESAQGIRPGSNNGSNVVWMDFASKKQVAAGDAQSRALEHITHMAIGPLLSELDEFSLLGDDWAGKGTKKPSQDSILAAKAFVESLKSAELPEISLADDGEISVYWRDADLYVDVSFRAEARSLYARIGAKTIKQRFDTLVLETMPSAVIERLATSPL